MVIVLCITSFNQVQAEGHLDDRIVNNILAVIDNPEHRLSLERNIRLGNITGMEELKDILSQMGYDEPALDSAASDPDGVDISAQAGTLDDSLNDMRACEDRYNNYEKAYSAADNLSNDSLKDFLKKSFSEHICMEYGPAKAHMYRVIDNYNGKVTGVYTGSVFSAPKNKNYNPQEDIKAKRSFMNCEHTWPQSFFEKLEPMRSDIWHLYPTDSAANGTRSSYPFGEVDDGIKWESNGSALGLSNDGRTVFEPRDQHKGNVARSMFYFSVIYNKPIDSAQEEVFRKWHQLDPVDTQERERADRIERVQHNRNPFIDRPEYVSKIKDF
jgi:hypothetical protein